MPIRLVPPTDDAEFPYERARARILSLESVTTGEVDFPAMIAVGRRIGWPQILIDEHFALLQRGKCFNFTSEEEPSLSGTLFEDKIWFGFTDGENEEACRPVIESLAKELGLRIMEH